MKKTVLMFAALLAFAGTKAFAQDTGTFGTDNTVQVSLDADVTRSCNLDFQSTGIANQSVQTAAQVAGAGILPNAISAQGGAAPTTVTMDPISVYETCNDNFVLSFTSLNGGMALPDPATPGSNLVVLPYNIGYANSADGSAAYSTTSNQIASGSAIAEAVSGGATITTATHGQVAKSLATFQAQGGSNVGSSWNASQSVLSLSLTQGVALPMGHYNDLLNIEMSAN